jgi:hypothetical protein
MTAVTASLAPAPRRGPRLTWFVWRQHRAQLLAGAVLVAALAGFMLWTHHVMEDYLRSGGLGACVAEGGDCDRLQMEFRDRFDPLLSIVGWFNFFPLVIGMFWGAPLVAREIEQGTHRLVWTQSVTRRRWFLVRVGTVAVTATLMTLAFSAVTAWWFLEFEEQGPFGASRMADNVYNFSGLVPVGFTLYALALAVVTGVLLRRTLPAMAVTLVLWLPVRLWFESLRSHFRAPLTISYPPFSGSPREGLGDWVISSRMVGPDGQPLGFMRAGDGPCSQSFDKAEVGRCLADNGYHQVDTYQPASRFWELQSIELGLYLGLAVVLIVVAYALVTRRRTS